MCEFFEPPASPDQIAKLKAAYETRGELEDIDNAAHFYSSDSGLFLVLVDRDQVVGTGAIRRLTNDTAELKRMWFLPEYRGRGFGKQMATQLINFAHEVGYKCIRLDTDDKLIAAIGLYEHLGFKPIPRYNDSVCNRFLELSL